MEEKSKNTMVLPEAVVARIQQIQEQWELEAVKIKTRVGGICEGLILAGGFTTTGKWTLRPDGTTIEFEGDK